MTRRAHCHICDAEIDEPGLCAACQRELATPIRLPAAQEPAQEAPAPRRGIHVAGPVVAHQQACVRCGDVLAREFSRKYPEGALVERGRGYDGCSWQAMYLGVRDANCDPAPVGELTLSSAEDYAGRS